MKWKLKQNYSLFLENLIWADGQHFANFCNPMISLFGKLAPLKICKPLQKWCHPISDCPNANMDLVYTSCDL